MAERNKISRGAVRRTGSGIAGVEQLLAGAGITLSPINGIGVVTITATAGGGSTLMETGVTNSTASLIPGTSVVQLTGNMTMGIAQANSPANSNGVFGIIAVDTPPAGTSTVATGGLATVSLEAGPVFTAGDQLWLSATTAGAVTNVQPATNAIHIGVLKNQLGLLGFADLNIYPAGVTTFNGAPGAITLTTPNPGLNLTQTGGAEVLTQRIVADWPQANIRVYAIDPVNGLDTNAGFADAAGPSAGQYATACAAAGAVAKQTIAGLALIFPKFGAGRLCEVVIRNGGVNTASAFAETLAQLWNGVNGYALAGPVVRGTGTNTTAGAVAFDGSTADVTYQGAITVTGLNVAGYNPVGATTTNLPCQLNGGGAPALPAEPAAPLGWRVRFDAATTTVALRNQCRHISQVSGGNTIIPQSAFSAAPANADIFYIEQPGVTVTVADTMTGLAYHTPENIAAVTFGAQISGIRWTSTLSICSIQARLSFLGATGFNVSGDQSLLNVNQSINHPVLGLLNLGGGFRAEAALSAANFAAFGKLSLSGLVIGANNLIIVACENLLWRDGSFTSGTVNWRNTIQQSGTDSGATSTQQIGSSATAIRSPRAARLSIENSSGQIGACVFSPAGATPAVKVTGHCVISFDNGVCSGTTGNTDVGLDLTASRGSLIILTTTPTVTGTLGDVRLAGGQIVTWAQAIATGITDSAGNRIIGTAGVPPQAITPFSGSIIGAVGAVVSYLSNTGPIAANQIVALRRPTSFRLATRLRVTNLVNTSANAVTVTLYKNGVATAMVVAIPAATAANTKFSDIVHPILFLDGDDFDLRMDDAADVAGVVTVSAALEWAV